MSAGVGPNRSVGSVSGGRVGGGGAPAFAAGTSGERVESRLVLLEPTGQPGLIGGAPRRARAFPENPPGFGVIHPFRRRWRHGEPLRLGPLVGGREVGRRVVDSAVGGSIARDQLPDGGGGVLLRRNAARPQIDDRLEIIGEAIGGERFGDPRGLCGDHQGGSRGEKRPQLLPDDEPDRRHDQGPFDPTDQSSLQHGESPAI